MRALIAAGLLLVPMTASAVFCARPYPKMIISSTNPTAVPHSVIWNGYWGTDADGITYRIGICEWVDNDFLFADSIETIDPPPPIGWKIDATWDASAHPPGGHMILDPVMCTRKFVGPTLIFNCS